MGSVNLALMLFSGPWSWKDYYKCTGEMRGVTVTAEACGIQFVSHFTTDTAAVAKLAAKMEWPSRSTLTSYALAEAKSELITGRRDAKSVVVVITDGKPLSKRKTKTASEELKKLSRLIWVPVGNGVKGTIKQMRRWATQPWQDNLLVVDSFSVLESPSTINKMVSEFCAQMDSSLPEPSFGQLRSLRLGGVAVHDSQVDRFDEGSRPGPMRRS